MNLEDFNVTPLTNIEEVNIEGGSEVNDYIWYKIGQAAAHVVNGVENFAKSYGQVKTHGPAFA
ncbi:MULTISPECIES: hypothetical protein [Emticicia]|uniref:hypothetical protein n=1 Tax=Emticicia TaxID=312278 RepID=UPI0012E79410|nr:MULTISPECIES: hypothetical protein [Emticicia]